MTEQKHDDARGASHSDAELEGEYAECDWTPDTPDACPYCSGAACLKCGPAYFGRPDCNCDSLDRHKKPANAPGKPTAANEPNEGENA